MRLIAVLLAFLCFASSDAAVAKGSQDVRGSDGTTIHLDGKAQDSHRQAVAEARIKTRRSKVTTGGAVKVNGEGTKAVGAGFVCQGFDELGADYGNSEDTKTVIDTDPVTGVQTTRDVVVRRWIRVIVTCDGTQYVVRRCTFGDCPVGTEAGGDTYPSIELLMDQARDAADYEVPDAILSPAIKPGKAPIPGMPLFFAVSQEQWSRVVTSYAKACNGVLCVYARVDAKVVGLEFDPGDGGKSILCSTPGVVVRSAGEYRSASRKCSYTYQTAGTHKGSLSLLYDATVSGGIDREAPTIVRPVERVVIEAELPVPVSEYQPVIIR